MVLEGDATPKTPQALALRARVLTSADGGLNAEVTAALGVSQAAVAKWRSWFLVGLDDGQRPGASRKITDEQVALVIRKTLEEQGPGQDTRWTTRSMAAATGLSQSAISRIWRAAGIKPR